MDMWLYYDATHGPLTYCNPISEQGVHDLELVLGLEEGQRVLEIASGHGEMMLGLASRYGVTGVGVDASPYAHARSLERKALRAPDADVEFVHGKGEEYETDERFDLVMCIGASWIWSGWEGTLDALVSFAKPGGLVVTGEPYWKQDPPAPYLEAEGLTADQFPGLDAYAEGIWARDLTLLWMRGSTVQEWDRYEMLQAAALDAFRRDDPAHEDLEAITARHIKDKRSYLRWGRDCLGFAFWVIRT